MARIIYGVNAEGLGHASRSKPTIDYLMKHHEVLILTDSKPYEFLSKFYKENLVRGRGFNIVYEKNKINLFKTLDGIFNHPEKMTFFRTTNEIFNSFKPDIVITDGEPVTSLFARLRGLPLISIDNISALNVGSFRVAAKDIVNYEAARSLVRLWVPEADHFFICSFFDFKIRKIYRKKGNVSIIKPVLRDEIVKLKGAKEGDYILVYQTHDNNIELSKLLSKVDYKFHAVKLPKYSGAKNVIFKDVNPKTFPNEIAHAKAIIINGGFSLMSEALFLGKPVLSLPVKGTYEQKLNAIKLQELGYGEYHEKMSKEIIERFIERIPFYKSNLRRYHGSGNKELFKALDSIIPKLIKNKELPLLLKVHRHMKKHIKMIKEDFVEAMND